MKMSSSRFLNCHWGAEMAVAMKDQERAGYAWMYGAQARKDGKERNVPEYWQEQAGA